MAEIVLLVIVLIVSIVLPALFYVRLRAEQRAETDRLLSRIEQSLGASVKLLEVRTYYDQMNGEYKKMLDEAYKEGNKFRADHVRRLQERLEQLKARTLDRTVRILDVQQGAASGGGGTGGGQQRHRRRGGRRHHRPGGPGNGGPGGGSGGGAGGQPYGAPRGEGPSQPPSQPQG